MNPKMLAVAGATIAIMAVLLTGAAGSTFSAVMGLLLVFVLPGYALANALFPGKDLEYAELVALTLGLSLAVTALGGLVLYLLPWKLESRSWTVLLGSITLLASVVGLLRRPPQGAEPPLPTKVHVSLSLRDAALLILAGIAVAAAFALTYRAEVEQNNSDFTQLWIQPDKQADLTVHVGINNHAADETQYRLLIKVNGTVVEEMPLIELGSEETWTHAFSLPEGAQSVSAVLYRLYAAASMCSGANPPDACRRNAEIYREVQLWK